MTQYHIVLNFLIQDYLYSHKVGNRMCTVSMLMARPIVEFGDYKVMIYEYEYRSSYVLDVCAGLYMCLVCVCGVLICCLIFIAL